MKIITGANLEGRVSPIPTDLPQEGGAAPPLTPPRCLPREETPPPPSQAGTRGRRSGSDTFLSRDQVETPSPRRKPGAPHWGRSLRRGGIRSLAGRGGGQGTAGEPVPAPHSLMNMNEPAGESRSARRPRPSWLRPRLGPATGGVAMPQTLRPSHPARGLLPAGAPRT